MKTLCLKKSTVPGLVKSNLILKVYIIMFLFSVFALHSPASAQSVLFDFDNAPLYTSLPLDQTAANITAHIAATGQGYSIQDANVLGFTPPGFAGHVLYPNSINISDLLISYDHTITDFSIMYSCQELACDDAATMRVTAYMSGLFTGTSTKVAAHPGTWPVDTLRCTFPQGFDSVVVHYDSRPPTCQDYGVIYLADNMRVTPVYPTGIWNQNNIMEQLIIPNPVSQSAIISFSLLRAEHIHVSVYDMTGRFIRNLFDGTLNTGEHQIKWDINDGAIEGGLFLLNISGENFSRSGKIIVLK